MCRYDGRSLELTGPYLLGAFVLNSLLRISYNYVSSLICDAGEMFSDWIWVDGRALCYVIWSVSSATMDAVANGSMRKSRNRELCRVRPRNLFSWTLR